MSSSGPGRQEAHRLGGVCRNGLHAAGLSGRRSRGRWIQLRSFDAVMQRGGEAVRL